MTEMNFEELFEVYGETATRIVEAPGHHDQQTGLWVPGTLVESEIDGIILPLSGADLRFDAPGTYTVSDRKLYVRQKLGLGEQVRDAADLVYRVLAERDYNQHAAFWVYILRREGASA